MSHSLARSLTHSLLSPWDKGLFSSKFQSVLNHCAMVHQSSLSRDGEFELLEEMLVVDLLLLVFFAFLVLLDEVGPIRVGSETGFLQRLHHFVIVSLLHPLCVRITQQLFGKIQPFQFEDVDEFREFNENV